MADFTKLFRNWQMADWLERGQAANRWAQGGAVIDELTGLPKVIYSGAPYSNFDRFLFAKAGVNTGNQDAKSLIAWGVADPRVASEYAQQSLRMGIPLHEWEKALGREGYQPGIIPLFYKMQNPVVADMNGLKYNEKIFTDLARKATSDSHDGLIVRNVNDAPGESNISDVFAVKDPTQVKSIFNIGTFDPTNPSFLKTVGPFGVGAGAAGMAFGDSREAQAATTPQGGDAQDGSSSRQSGQALQEAPETGGGASPETQSSFDQGGQGQSGYQPFIPSSRNAGWQRDGSRVLGTMRFPTHDDDGRDLRSDEERQADERNERVGRPAPAPADTKGQAGEAPGRPGWSDWSGWPTPPDNAPSWGLDNVRSPAGPGEASFGQSPGTGAGYAHPAPWDSFHPSWAGSGWQPSRTPERDFRDQAGHVGSVAARGAAEGVSDLPVLAAEGAGWLRRRGYLPDLPDTPAANTAKSVFPGLQVYGGLLSGLDALEARGGAMKAREGLLDALSLDKPENGFEESVAGASNMLGGLFGTGGAAGLFKAGTRELASQSALGAALPHAGWALDTMNRAAMPSDEYVRDVLAQGME